MKYKQLGRTGVRVSTIGLGTAAFGVAPLEHDADALVGRALDLGINVIDCANSYGNQPRFDRPGAPPAAERASAEEIVGRVLKGRRDRVVLSSKVMEPIGPGPNDHGLSRRHIFEQVERSLKRLATDHLDIYYAHHPDPTTPLEETLRAFDDLVRQGKILYCALSTFPAWQLMDALWKSERLGAQPPCAIQLPYSLADRRCERDLGPACAANGVSIMVFSPLSGGLLAGPAARNREFIGRKRWGGGTFTPDQVAVAEALERQALEFGHAPSQVALAWLLSRPAVASAIIGPEAIAELESAAEASDLDLPAELLTALDAINAPRASAFGL